MKSQSIGQKQKFWDLSTRFQSLTYQLTKTIFILDMHRKEVLFYDKPVYVYICVHLKNQVLLRKNPETLLKIHLQQSSQGQQQKKKQRFSVWVPKKGKNSKKKNKTHNIFWMLISFKNFMKIKKKSYPASLSASIGVEDGVFPSEET